MLPDILEPTDSVDILDARDRCAAYVATRTTSDTVHRIVARWPRDLAEHAMSAARDAVSGTADALSHAHATAARRRCLRDALTSAVEVAAACDVARALGITSKDLDDATRTASRAISLLAMFLHAASTPLDDED